MFSEGIHSLVDTGNQILLLWGLKQARKPASAEFPFGHGKEVYFWSFIVAMLIFALGGAASIYQGVQHLDHAEPLSNTFVNFIVLGLALVFELAALSIAVKELNKSRGDQGWLQTVRNGKDPTLFVVVFEDTAATLGLLIALTGLVMFELTGEVAYDAGASIAIGCVLILSAFWLALESKGLLIGESASPVVRAQIRSILELQANVVAVNEIATLHMGPDYILVTLSADFIDGISSGEVERTVAVVREQVMDVDARIRRVFVEVKTSREQAAAAG